MPRLRWEWLTIVVAITVPFTSQTSFAHDHDNTSLLSSPSQDVKSHDNFTIEITKCSSYPPVSCAFDDEVLCATASPNTVTDTTQIESSIVTFQTISECVSELQDAIEDKNRTIQRMEREYRKVLNETYHKIDDLEEKLGKQERQMKTTEERYQSSRKQVSEIDDELRKMHSAAVRQYLNTTLMREDAWNGIERAFTKTARRVERRWGYQYRRMRQLLYVNKQKWYRKRMEARFRLKPRIEFLRRNVQKRWGKSTLVRPLLNRLDTTAKNSVYELYRPLQPILDEVKVACRLTTISAIEEGSKTILNFLERNERLHLEREQSRNKREDPMQRHLEYKRRHRRRESRNREVEFTPVKIAKPSLMNLKARALFKYARENSTQIYQVIVSSAPLAFALYLSRCCIIGSLSWFIGIPHPVLWAVAVYRIMKRRKKAQ